MGLAGVAGTPALVGTGSLFAGTPVALSLTQARPFAFSPLIVGLSAINAPFKGGTLVPNPDFVFPLFSDFFGAWSFAGLWPAGIPAGVTIRFQAWIQDPAGPQAFAASNAISATTP
jgi:hypothetical protein